MFEFAITINIPDMVIEYYWCNSSYKGYINNLIYCVKEQFCFAEKAIFFIHNFINRFEGCGFTRL